MMRRSSRQELIVESWKLITLNLKSFVNIVKIFYWWPLLERWAGEWFIFELIFFISALFPGNGLCCLFDCRCLHVFVLVWLKPLLICCIGFDLLTFCDSLIALFFVGSLGGNISLLFWKSFVNCFSTFFVL